MEVGKYLSASQKKRKQRRKYIIVILFVLAACLALFGAFWLVFKSPVFKIKNDIVVQGNASVASGDIIALVRSVALKKQNPVVALLGMGNILAWPNTISSSDISAIPELANVNIKKDYMMRAITITVEERKPFATWCFMSKNGTFDASGADTATTTAENATMEPDEQCYWFDDAGVMFERGFDSEGSIILAVHDYSQDPAPLGAAILPVRFIPNVISIVNVLHASGLNVKEVRLNDVGLQEIQATTYDGPDILFSLRFPADNDLPVIQSIMTKPGFSNLQYLDFRTENRAYYQ